MANVEKLPENNCDEHIKELTESSYRSGLTVSALVMLNETIVDYKIMLADGRAWSNLPNPIAVLDSIQEKLKLRIQRMNDAADLFDKFNITVDKKFNLTIKDKPQPGNNQPVKGDRLQMPTIALIQVYLNMTVKNHVGITEANKEEVSAQFGWVSRNSGKKLLQHYNKLYNSSNRMNLQENKKSDLTKLKHIEKAIKYLKEKKFVAATSRAESEFSSLENLIKQKY